MAECRHYKICDLEADHSTELCILHSEDPEKPLDTFNEAFAKHCEANGYNFAHMFFPDVVDFSQRTYTKHVDFTNATFAKLANFNGAIFTQQAKFTNATFADGASFGGAKFKEMAFFDFATFNEGLPFHRNAVFLRATFTKGVSFFRAHFAVRASFIHTTFKKLANFNFVIFRSEADFQEARFAGRVIFSCGRFDGRTLFTGRLENRQPIPTFSEAQEVDFRDVIFGASDVIFRHANLQKCRFLNTDLRQVQLVDITWARKKPRFTLAGRKYTKWHRLCLYDEIAPLNPEENLPWGQLEHLYRQLKRNYEEQRDYERAGDFHYGEKEMRRQNSDTSWWHRFLLLWPYWLISGYGERIWRPLVAAGVILAAFAFVCLLYRLTPTKPSTSVRPLALNNIVAWGEALLYSFRVMTLQKPQDFVLSGLLINLIHTLQGLIGPFLIGLIALAVRQRLKR